MRRVCSLALVFITIAGFTLGVASPAEAKVTTKERRLVRMVNNARDARGLPKLRAVSSLCDLSRRHSRKMADAKQIFHTADLEYALRNYTWQYAGENVGRSTTVRRMFRAFMRSEGHRANILSKRYRSIGIGIVPRGSYLYVTMTFIG